MVHSAAYYGRRRSYRCAKGGSGQYSASVDKSDVYACLCYAFRESARKPIAVNDKVYVSGWGYGQVKRYCGNRVYIQGDYGNLTFPLSRCQAAIADRGMDYPDYRSWLIKNDKIKNPIETSVRFAQST